jgi:hypothetical protein
VISEAYIYFFLNKESSLKITHYYCDHVVGQCLLNVVDRGTILQAGMSRVRFPMKSLNFSIDLGASSRTIILGLTRPLTEMNTRILLGGKGRPARNTDLTSIYEPIL